MDFIVVVLRFEISCSILEKEIRFYPLKIVVVVVVVVIVVVVIILFYID